MIVVYTALFGNYDNLIPVQRIPGVRHVAFTDQAERGSGWECLRPPRTEATNAMENRKYKTRPHVLFPEAEWTIYVDANLELTASPHDIVNECRNGLNVFHHNRRRCAYAEADVVRPRVHGAVLDNQLERYRKRGFPKDFGLFWGGLLIRNNKANELNEHWWTELQNGIGRDQVSLPYSIWETGAPHHILSGGIPFYNDTNRFCTRRPHKKHFGA